MEFFLTGSAQRSKEREGKSEKNP